jgi:hypothetical protein
MSNSGFSEEEKKMMEQPKKSSNEQKRDETAITIKKNLNENTNTTTFLRNDNPTVRD